MPRGLCGNSLLPQHIAVANALCGVAYCDGTALLFPWMGHRDSIVPVHRMQVSKWSSEQRGRFDSVMSAITVPGAALSGPLIGRLGNLRLLQLGLCSQLANALLLSQATAGLHFYLAAPAAMLTTGAVSALSAMTIVAGAAIIVSQGWFWNSEAHVCDRQGGWLATG